MGADAAAELGAWVAAFDLIPADAYPGREFGESCYHGHIGGSHVQITGVTDTDALHAYVEREALSELDRLRPGHNLSAADAADEVQRLYRAGVRPHTHT